MRSSRSTTSPRLDVALVAPAPTLLGVNHRDLAHVRDRHVADRADRAARAGRASCSSARAASRPPPTSRRLGDAGAHAVLVGETLMRAPSPGAALRELLGSMTHAIKICGVTLADDAARVAAAGADFIGLNFWPRSKRYLAPERAPLIAAAARGAGAAPSSSACSSIADRRRGPRDRAGGRARRHPAPRRREPPTSASGSRSPSTARSGRRSPCRRRATSSTSTSGPSTPILLDAPDARPRRRRRDASTGSLARRRSRASPAHPRRARRRARRRTTSRAAIAAVEPWAVDVASGVEAAPGHQGSGEARRVRRRGPSR